MRQLIKYSGIAILVLTFSGIMISNSVAQTNEQDLGAAVKAKISNYYPENQISVKTSENGRIELKGTVNVLYDKLKMFEIVSSVKGVHYIENNIEVDTQSLPDKEIEANIKNELSLVKSISEPDLLNVDVSNGVVILRGKVRFQHESTVMETIASWQEGVQGIVNELQVIPISKAISDGTLSGAINDLLENQFREEKQVNFDVNHGKVTLNGNVRTLWAKDHIEKEIQRIVGVTEITNNLNIADYIG